MIVVMRTGATDRDVEHVLDVLRERELTTHVSRGVARTVIGVLGPVGPTGVPNALPSITPELGETLEALEGVEAVLPVSKPYKLASREFHPESTVVRVSSPRGDVLVGGDEVVMMAGPCTVESEEQLLAAARAAQVGGARILRGGAYKPSTSPYGFRGMGEEGLKLLAQARAETGLAVVTEVMTPTDVALVCEYADVLQIGARNMQNYYLLDEVGQTRMPVLLKRGLAATIEEWLLAAEYILARGNPNVMLCERGIRTFERATRNTVDINAVPLVKQLSHLPVVVDPSQGTGKRSLVDAVTLAAVAAGADGLIVEIHPHPDAALKDGAQSLTLEQYSSLMPRMRAVAAAVGRG
ncbi:MAG TPA: 3-deoxy-7-phosphoheptulonate synthase [Ktedonobacterales bacterium]|jgi:3-deoxy-7-phosphoheptulonate synthase|nr:3-deoxy-7-phosphoheptulonate synthase [Ktedonobacterales bacterium]